jgi:hypothetical protein
MRIVLYQGSLPSAALSSSSIILRRTVTRLIRSGSGGRAGLGNVHIGGNHVHHQVFGILIMIGTGILLVSEMPRGAGLDGAAAAFGVGIGLTVDEFARWLHLARRAARRHQRQEERWNWLRDFVAGAPSLVSERISERISDRPH